MTTSSQPEGASSVQMKARLSRILRWAGRVTSLPVLGLLLTSLIPAVLSFNLSATDDKVIAVGLGLTLVGVLTGWKWPGMGGLTVLLGVGVILSQGESILYPDPFAVGFALQGILFLISWSFDAQAKGRRELPARFKNASLGGLAAFAAVAIFAIVRGPGPTPVPRDKATFIGIWQNPAGLRLEVSPEGRAKVIEQKDSKLEACNSPVGAGQTEDFLASFRGDDQLELSKGTFGPIKVYHIDRYPHKEGDQTNMVLNGSSPYKKGSGILLVKQPG